MAAEASSRESMSTAELFDEYIRNPSEELKWEIVLRYTGMVRRVASQTRGLYSSFAETDDIINEGLLVLAEAVDKYDPSRGSFSTFVTKRIWGMVIDLFRANTWGPRLSAQGKKEIDDAIDELATELGRYPTDHEVAERLGLSDSVYKRRVEKYAFQNLLSWEELFVESPHQTGAGEDPNSPVKAVENADLLNTLAEAIRTLRPKQQLVLSLYYKEGLTMEEIATVMGVSRSRVCQVHKGAIARLQQIMGRELIE